MRRDHGGDLGDGEEVGGEAEVGDGGQLGLQAVAHCGVVHLGGDEPGDAGLGAGGEFGVGFGGDADDVGLGDHGD